MNQMDRKTHRQRLVFVLGLLAGCVDLTTGDAPSTDASTGLGGSGPATTTSGGSSGSSGGASTDASSSSGGEETSTSTGEGLDSTGDPVCAIVWAEQPGPDGTCQCEDGTTTHATAGSCGPCVWIDAARTCSCPGGEGPPEWCLPLPGGCVALPVWGGNECTCEGDDGSVLVLPWPQAQCHPR